MGCDAPLVVIESMGSGQFLAGARIMCSGERWCFVGWGVIIGLFSDNPILNESQSMPDLETGLVSKISSCIDITYGSSGKTEAPYRLFEGGVWVFDS